MHVSPVMQRNLVIAGILGSLTAACGQGTVVIPDVTYDSRFGDATKMDIYMPDTAPDTRRPAVMLIHGGAWKWGNRDNYADASERYAAAGYVAATIEYRLVPAGTYPAAVQDCLCALSFLRAHADDYGIDPDRIAVSGYSAGAQLTALVAIAPDNPAHQPDCEWGPTGAPAAAIPGDGVYDFTGNDNSWVKDFLGGSNDEVPDNYANASPALQIGDDEPPFLVVHGQDDVLSVGKAGELVDLLRAHGNQARLLELGAAGHILSPTTPTDGAYLQPSTDMPEAWAVTLDFLANTLGAP